MDEEEIGLKIEDIMCTFKNMDGGPGKLIVGVSKAMEQINDLIDKHKKNEEAPPSLSQETLLTLLTIVGREVDLHTNNGDVYTGILYVVSPETELGIQLKQCKLGNGIIVDTQDIALNQISKIVAKGVTVLVENLGRSFLILDEQPNYQIDIQRISSGEDTRSSLIIKNIPKRYTSEMLISEINDTQPGTFDFIYLPLVKKREKSKKNLFFYGVHKIANFVLNLTRLNSGRNAPKIARNGTVNAEKMVMERNPVLTRFWSRVDPPEVEDTLFMLQSFLILDEQPNYQIDIQRISSGEDTRSSLIIKNIP
ncbi:uncharacterized protein LOC123904306 [Trifolium pratense]|uniref:uncharacterized protein LOC123904306 n=1 Tax=Trifolium pratense TaxID=57577 RepID=UPI001E6934CE|nr:uncharacterized protein LOC123904306 [Trifolium pratense]